MSDERANHPKDFKEPEDALNDNSETTAPKPGAKRRASRAGTRSVASLTPEQLARKRANDREAQRSIRQRTKNHIEELERRIQNLSAENNEKNIEELQRRNAELEAELRHLKEVLGRSNSDAVSSSSSLDLTPLSSRYGMEVLERSQPYAHPPQWSTQNTFTRSLSPYPTSSAGDLLSSLVPDYSPLNTTYSKPSSLGNDAYNTGVSLGEMTNPLPGMVSAAPARPRGSGYNSRPNFGRSRSYPNGRLGQPAWQSSFPTLSSTRMQGNVKSIPVSSVTGHPISATPTVNPMMLNGIEQASIASHEISSSFSSSRMKVNVSGLGALTVTGPVSPARNMMMRGLPLSNGGSMRMDPTAMSIQPETPPYELPHRTVEQPSPQSWEIPLRFAPPTGPVDSILLSLLQRQRALSLEGTTGVALTGPKTPCLRVLVDPEHSNGVDPVASILSNLLQRLSFNSLAEKVAVLLITYHLIQWQISPSQETYNNIPEWFVPRASQLFTGHPVWTTLIPWGKLKDKVIANQRQYATDEFHHIYTSSLNLNWPYRDLDAIAFEGDEVRASDAFVQHVYNLSNWSLDEPFQRKYPELRDACRFTEFPIPQMNGIGQ